MAPVAAARRRDLPPGREHGATAHQKGSNKDGGKGKAVRHGLSFLRLEQDL